MQWWLNSCSLYVCTFLSLAHTILFILIFRYDIFVIFFRFSCFNHLISLPLHRLFIMLYTCTHFFSWNLYQTHRKFMFFRFFIDIFPESWKKNALDRRHLCICCFRFVSVWMFYSSFICKEIEQVAIETNGCQTD